ncbi:unnamed protein product, partial [Brugia timori]|uniref:Chromosomal replication initiator protein n=1 Tax=Brugia timori TaxID=42155 RepID=A0A0R3QHI3_9BILA
AVGQLPDQRAGGQHGDRHAGHAEDVAADRGGGMAQALERLDEADAGQQVQQGDEHAPRDQEAAEDVDRRQRDGQHAHGLAQAGLGERGGQHGAHDDDRRDGVGHGHQRRVQRGRDGPHHVVAHVDGQHEDDEVDDGVRDDVHGFFSSHVRLLLRDLAVLRDAAGGDDVVLEVDLQRALLGQHELEEVEHVARVQRRGVGSHQRGEVRFADDGHAVLDHRLVGFGQRAVAAHAIRALAGGDVDDDAAGLHGLDHVLGDEGRRGTARDQRGADDDVGQRHALGDLGLLAREPARGHRARIAAHALGGVLLFLGLVRHVDELAAQRFDLLLDAGANVRGLDDRAQALGRGDGLQARDAHAE